MGKYSDFDRNPRDFYPTPADAVKPLLPFVRNNTFAEPCAGDGALIDHLTAAGLKCVHASDIHPLRDDIMQMNAMDYKGSDSVPIITNPPWDRAILHPMIERFRNVAPTWLLFDADWMHTIQAAPFLEYCARIVSIGRVKWIADSDSTGKENACWYLFMKDKQMTVFTGREIVTERCNETREMFL